MLWAEGVDGQLNAQWNAVLQEAAKSTQSWLLKEETSQVLVLEVCVCDERALQCALQAVATFVETGEFDVGYYAVACVRMSVMRGLAWHEEVLQPNVWLQRFREADGVGGTAKSLLLQIAVEKTDCGVKVWDRGLLGSIAEWQCDSGWKTAKELRVDCELYRVQLRRTCTHHVARVYGKFSC